MPATLPSLVAGQLHSIEVGSFEMELTNRLSHINPIFREDNEVVYPLLYEDAQGTSYAMSLKPHKRTKDGRGYFQAITSQYSSEDNWELEINKD